MSKNLNLELLEELPPIDDESEEPTVIGGVRGIAFADLNANGVFDSATGEYPLGWAYFKLAGACGNQACRNSGGLE